MQLRLTADVRNAPLIVDASHASSNSASAQPQVPVRAMVALLGHARGAPMSPHDVQC